MIHHTVTPHMKQEAEGMADEMGKLNNSIRQGDGNVYGFIGELVFAHLTGANQNNTYDWDVEMPDSRTVDVKSKCVTSPPMPHYECSVASIGTNQNCDYYAFMRVLKDCTEAWYLGSIPKKDFLNQATFMEAGVWEDPSNGWTPTIDCYNLPISDLHLDESNPENLSPLPQ